jgi:hypothetical protein
MWYIMHKTFTDVNKNHCLVQKSSHCFRLLDPSGVVYSGPRKVIDVTLGVIDSSRRFKLNLIPGQENERWQNNTLYQCIHLNSNVEIDFLIFPTQQI